MAWREERGKQDGGNLIAAASIIANLIFMQTETNKTLHNICR
jgi:hypothetical protein